MTEIEGKPEDPNFSSATSIEQRRELLGLEASVGGKKEQRLQKLRIEVGNIHDGLGFPVDRGITETVVALKALNFPTSQSCEGHFKGVKGETSTKYKDGRLFKGRFCQKQFTVRVGTVFEDSQIPLQKWFLAIYLATSLKSGISSIQLSKYLGVTQKTAWFMLHRIRKVIELENLELSGTIETDETYIGGKVINRQKSKRDKDDIKAVVFGMVERQGKTVMKHVISSGTRSLIPKIEKTIKKDSSKIFSDEWGSYRSLNRLGYLHGKVNHRRGEYVKVRFTPTPSRVFGAN